jgi:hypothetical protein
MAHQPCPVQGVFALLEPPLRHPPAIEEVGYAFGLIAQVSHNEAHPDYTEDCCLFPVLRERYNVALEILRVCKIS